MSTSNEVKLLVDCGGSGVKIRRYAQGVIDTHTQRFSPKTLVDFYQCLEDVAKGSNPSVPSQVTGIAISLCGEYDYVNEVAVSCWAYPFLIGNLRDKLKARFQCGNVCIVNDGDAHALALKSARKQKGLSPCSAINLSLGTAVGFGILDWKGDLLHTCRGHNWEVGWWQCDTRATHTQQYWALGSEGLKELENQHGKTPDCYIYYGQRLCHFFGRDLAPVFHPKIIGLSGGIVAAHFNEINEGIRRECEKQDYRASGGSLDGVDIYLSQEPDSVMKGLADLLGQNSNPANDLGDCKKLAKTFQENRPCALLAVHVGQVVCAENGGDDPIVANRGTVQGDWESFTLIKNDDGSVSLKSSANDKYVSAFPLPDGRLVAAGLKVDLWEKFDLKEVSGKSRVFTLWSRNTQKYVSVDESKGNVLIADRDVADTWEEFSCLLQ